MTWQERLRQLDAQLANGEIGAADYRRTRDEILAEASSGNQANGQESTKEGLWTATRPSDEPNTVNMQTDVAPGETTVVVRQDELTDERTQVVRADVMAPPAGQAPPPPWPARMNGPWSAPIQGQEVFAGAAKESNKRWLRWVVPLLIIALIAAGLWWFVFREDTSPQGQNEQPPSVTPTEQAAPGADDVAADLPQLPGDPATGSDGTAATTAEALEQQLLTAGYAELLADGGVREIVHRRSTHEGVGYLLMAAPVDPESGANELAGLTSDHLEQAGFTAVEATEGEPTILTRTDQIFQTYVTTYAAGDVWVQLNASGKPDGDPEALLAEFRTVLQSLTERLPVG